MTDEERAVIDAWFAAGAKEPDPIMTKQALLIDGFNLTAEQVLACARDRGGEPDLRWVAVPIFRQRERQRGLG